MTERTIEEKRAFVKGHFEAVAKECDARLEEARAQITKIEAFKKFVEYRAWAAANMLGVELDLLIADWAAYSHSERARHQARIAAINVIETIEIWNNPTVAAVEEP